jgi:hypothetical protein
VIATIDMVIYLNAPLAPLNLKKQIIQNNTYN